MISVGDESGNQEEDRCDVRDLLRHTAGILSRFFKASDIVGYYGEGRFAVFLSGQLTKNRIQEKAGTLSEVLRITLEESTGVVLPGYIGIYLFDNSAAEVEEIYGYGGDSGGE